MIRIARRVISETGKPDRILRASLVGCDFPLCEKALELPVNLQSSNNQCIRDTIRFIDREHPHGWKTAQRGTFCYCRIHAAMKGVK